MEVLGDFFMVHKILKVLLIGLSSIGLFFIGQSSYIVSASQTPNKVINTHDNVKDRVFESSQTNTTIEQVQDYFLVQDSDTQKQYTLKKDKKIDFRGQKMQSYISSDSKKMVLFLSKGKKEIIYKNNKFELLKTGRKILNVQTAINRVKAKINLDHVTFGGSNIRLTSRSGRLYYRINVYQSHQLVRTYRVYSDNGNVYWIK